MDSRLCLGQFPCAAKMVYSFILDLSAGCGHILQNLCPKKSPCKLLRSAVALFLAAVCLFTAVLPGSKVLLGSDNMAESATMADSTYYYEHPDGKKAKREVQFQISEYTADLRVFTKLHAKVTMKIDTPDLEEYTFTLYHGYKIKSAKDQNGNALQFKQEEDHFTVAPNGNTTEITVKYSGFSPVFLFKRAGHFPARLFCLSAAKRIASAL